MRLRKLRIQVAGLLLLMSLAGVSAIRQARKNVAVDNKIGNGEKAAQDSLPSCWDPMPPASGKGSQHRPSHHSVTLSWKASVPISKSPQDAVKGYFVYRSQTSQKHALGDRLNAQPITGAGCVDGAVEPQTTYFYSVRALSQGGAQSIFSQEVNAVVPSP